jgi:MFS family permease
MTAMLALRTALGRPRLVLFSCMFASQAALLVLSPILPDLAREFGVSTAAAGQLRTLSGATGGVTAVLLAVAPYRARLRTLLSAGAALVAAGAGLSAAAPSFTTLAAAQSVIGVGVGVLVAAALAAAGEWSTPSERPRTLAWAIARMPTAWVLGMPVVGAAASVDWRLAWLALPATTGVVALVLVRLARPIAAPAPAARSRGVAARRRRAVHGRRAARERRVGSASSPRGLVAHRGLRRAARHGVGGARPRSRGDDPGTFAARRRVPSASLLGGFTLAQAGAVAALGGWAPAPGCRSPSSP